MFKIITKYWLSILQFITSIYFIGSNIFFIKTLYEDYSEYYLEAFSLVLTNNFIIPTSYYLLLKARNDKLLLVDYLVSILLHFFSSYYHMCDVSITDNCKIRFSEIKYLDFYFSYTMVSLGVQYYLISSIPIKILLLIISLGFQAFIVWYDLENSLLNLSFILLKGLYIIINYLCNREYITNIIRYRLNKIPLLITLICIFVACLGRFYFTIIEKYWWVHSYLWHLFIFLGSYFNYKTLKYYYLSKKDFRRLRTNTDVDIDGTPTLTPIKIENKEMPELKLDVLTVVNTLSPRNKQKSNNNLETN